MSSANKTWGKLCCWLMLFTSTVKPSSDAGVALLERHPTRRMLASASEACQPKGRLHEKRHWRDGLYNQPPDGNYDSGPRNLCQHRSRFRLPRSRIEYMGHRNSECGP